METFKKADHNLAHGAFEGRWETTGELVSAVLDDTVTLEQQGIYGSTKLSDAGIAKTLAPRQPVSYIPGMGQAFDDCSSNSAIYRANMNAFAANRLQADAHTGPSFQSRPTTSLQPMTTSRQGRDTLSYHKSSRGSSGIEPQHTSSRPALEVSERSGLQQTTLFPAPAMPRQHANNEINNPEGYESGISQNRSGNRPCFKRQSTSILALTDSTKLNPQDVMAIRRSKTTRDTRKSTISKQKSVIKKMTHALTDRLHLTHKATEVEARKADEDRGFGFYDYESNQFIRDVKEDIPTQKRQLPSRLAQICERDEPHKDAEHMKDNSKVWISDGKRPNSSTSNASYDDPFADPDSTEGFTTDFVIRLKATTPQKDGRTPTLTTPSASPSNMDSLLRSSLNSLLPFPPAGASTPRITVHRRRSYVGDEAAKQWKLTNRMSTSVLALSAGFDAVEAELDRSSDDDSEDGMPGRGHNLAPMHGYTYQPVMNAPNRKKHPSPNKIDLELLETRLREKWPETLSQATENAKKHPSPLKVDIQALGEQFRNAYPDLLGGNTPDRSEKGDDHPYSILRSEDGTDELALSLAASTPEKRVTRHRKTSSLARFNQVAALDAKTKRKTIAMPKCAGLLNPEPHMQLACPAYHQA